VATINGNWEEDGRNLRKEEEQNGKRLIQSSQQRWKKRPKGTFRREVGEMVVLPPIDSSILPISHPTFHLCKTGRRGGFE
jgi:hypothetical protein